MPFWKGKSKGRDRESSSASESGDSPTSTASSQAQIPAPPEGNSSSQPSSSRRNERDHPAPAVGPVIRSTYSTYDVTGRPVQPIPVLDYQPPEHRRIPPPQTSSRRIYNMTGQSPQDDYPDTYTFANYKFGTASITTVTETSSQVDPLSSEDEFYPGADTTPRPSLAMQPEANHRSLRSDASSAHTFGTRSPASASETSLVAPVGNGDSQTRQQETPQDQPPSEDGPRVRYHPPPYLDSLYSYSTLSTSSANDEDYDFDEDDFSDPDLEVSSARYDGTGSYDQSYWDPPADEDSFIAAYSAHRRGSNPIPIPGTQQDGYHHGRDREDSEATLRYPTTSAPGPSTLAASDQSAPGAISLPGNGAEWDQRRRAIQDWSEPPTTSRPHPPTQAIDYASVPLQSDIWPSAEPSTQAEGVDVTTDFDMAEWGNIAQRGIKAGGDLGDVGAIPEIRSDNANIFRSLFAPNEAPRRPSIASTVNDTFQKHAMAFKTGHDWSFRKDKADGPAPSRRRRPIFIPFNERPLRRGPPWRGMGVGSTEYWRNEISGVYKVERLEIHANENRAPQQRLSIHHQRDGTRQPQHPIPGLPYDPHNGPTATVHKHSKAAAFSLSRHYRDKSHQSKSADRRGTSRPQPLRNAVYINGKKTAMILLAPRKVQEAYTSTTTTRKLESHGLLDDTPKSRDADRLQRLVEKEDRLREKQKNKEKARREKEVEKQKKASEEKAKKDKGKGRAVRSQGSIVQPETPPSVCVETDVSNPGTSTSQSEPVPITSLPAQPTPELDQPTPANTRAPTSPGSSVSSSLHSRAMAAQGPGASSSNVVTTRSVSSSSTLTAPVAESSTSPLQNIEGSTLDDSSILSSSSVAGPHRGARAGPPSRSVVPSVHASDRNLSSEQSLTNSSEVSWPRNTHAYGEYDEDVDEEDEQLGLVRRRKRTPHNEAYHSLSPESIDSFASQPDNHARSFLPWLGGRNNASSRSVGNHVEVPYNPPWLSAPSRPHNHDLQMQVVAGLNSSFQGVGLLPTDKEARETRRRKALKHQARVKSARKYTKEKDIFIDLPDEAVYMLLPLWPSETDPVSARDFPFQLPPIPISERLYALIYYRPYYPPPEPTKSQSKDKTRKSRGSPTASHDGIYIDDRNVLMGQFYIGARIVAYDDLEGSNVRVPELGLSVIGPLKEAFETIPTNTRPPRPGKSRKGGSGGQPEEKEFWDYIIGSYQSREHPVEFYPEGFKEMDLAIQKPEQPENGSSNGSTPPGSSVAGPSGSNGTGASSSSDGEPPSSSGGSPHLNGAGLSGSDEVGDPLSNDAGTSSPPSAPASNNSSANSSRVDLSEIAPFGEPGPSNVPAPATKLPPGEEDDIQEAPIILTPIGRAVLEMAFMGGLAVTSFAPQNYPW